MNALRVGIVQGNAGSDTGANLRNLEKLVVTVGPVDLIALPEVFAFRGGEADYPGIAEPLDGPVVQWASALARKRKAWVLAGSVIEKSGDAAYNTCVLLDRAGVMTASYRKIHLFEAQLDDGKVVREAASYLAGHEPVMAEIEEWRAGLSICYDLRFPELFRHYAKDGAHLLFVPSNFTQRTGRRHWETLLRARAIENQCFVVAPDQCGANPATGVESHGHSMAVGPWGDVLCEAGDAETTLTVTLDPAELEKTRRRVPALEHRRL